MWVCIKAQYIVIKRKIINIKTDLNQGIFATSGAKRDGKIVKMRPKSKVINYSSKSENIKKAKCSERDLCFFIIKLLDEING